METIVPKPNYQRDFANKSTIYFPDNKANVIFI